MAMEAAEAYQPPSVQVDQVIEAIFSLYRSSLARAHRLQSTSSATGNITVEWTILAAVCLVPEPSRDDHFPPTPIALGTGTKTLPFAKTSKPGVGDVLHDCHAEVMARRGARSWLCSRIIAERAARERGLEVVDGLPLLLEPSADGKGRLRLRDDVKCWWYVSTLPCGECSSPSLARRHQEEDRLLAAGRPEQPAEDNSTRGVVRGRHHLPHLDSRPTLRTVPGRRDSPPSISHSCTDKLLLWNLLGWQGSALSRCIDPIGIDALIISAPAEAAAASSSSTDHDLIAREVQRGLDVSARLEKLPHAPWHDAPRPPPPVTIIDRQFEHSQQALLSGSHSVCPDVVELIPSWTSTSWIRPSIKEGKAKDVEVIVGGIKQGSSLRRGEDGRLKEKSRSRLCKVSFMKKLQPLMGDAIGQQTTYAALKGKKSTAAAAKESDDTGVSVYRECKKRLRGGDGDGQAAWAMIEAWLRRAQQQQDAASDGSGGPGEEMSATAAPQAPLAGWLITPTDVEEFTIEGKRLDCGAATDRAQKSG